MSNIFKTPEQAKKDLEKLRKDILGKNGFEEDGKNIRNDFKTVGKYFDDLIGKR